MNDDTSDNMNLRASSRERKLTDKGLWWKVDTLRSNFRKSISALRSWSAKTEVLLSDSNDTHAIRKNRDILLEQMGEINSIYKQFTHMLEVECKTNEHRELLQDIHSDISKQFDTSENDNHELMKRISSHLQSIERDSAKSETRSQYTSNTRKSRADRMSQASTRKSNVSQRSQTASRAAELKAKLKFIDVEAKAKLDLDRIQTLRELEVTEATLEVLTRASQGSELDSLSDVLPKADMVDRFLQDVIPSATDNNIPNTIEPHVETQNYVEPYVIVNTYPDITQQRARSPVQSYSAPIVSQPDIDRSSEVHSAPEINLPISKDAPPTKTLSINSVPRRTDAINPIDSLTRTVKSVSLSSHDDRNVSQGHTELSVSRQGHSVSNSSPQGQGHSVVNANSTIPTTTIQPANIVSNSSAATLNPTAPTFVPQIVRNDSDEYLTSVQSLTKSIAEQFSLSRLPPPEPGIFCGDPLKYLSWKSAFQTLIERKQIPPNEKIHYLKKYLSDSVKEVVESLFVLSTDDAYEDAKRLLDERYGDNFTIANAFRNKLESWPKIQPRDGPGLRRFSDFIRQCLSAMNSISYLSVLNDDRENRKLLAKLPDWIVNRWCRKVVQYRDELKTFPPFAMFVEFIEIEAKIANDPVTSIQSIKSEPYSSRTDRFVNTRIDRTQNTYVPRYGRFNTDKHETPRRNVLATDTTSDTRSSAIKPTSLIVNNDKKTVCFLCNDGHHIDKCEQFLSKSLPERKDYAKRKGLCFGCLCHGHMTKKCRIRKRCQTCSKLHPTSLHDDNPNFDHSENAKETLNTKIPTQTGTSFLNYSESCCKSSMVLPVYLSHVDNPNNERLVYALLDTQSDTSFVLETTSKALGLAGTNVKLSLSTMHAENEVVDSCKIRNLVVRGYDSDTKLQIHVAFTRDIMPANRSHIPSSDMANKWDHLKRISDKLMPLSDCEIGLLIGYNCARALAPREVIPPVGNGPYAQRTDLGWGIVGVIDSQDDYDNEQFTFCHRIMSCEVSDRLSKLESSDEPKRVLMSVQTRTKEISPSEIARMMEMDFSDRHVDDPAISYDDRKFLKILNEGIQKVDGHYEMPLPFKDNNDPVLPNNKQLAISRFCSLRKRILRDTRYRTDYFNSMNDLMKKGFVERVKPSDTDVNGNVWYIPHHGVYHPQKPEKIRIVFDCSAKHKGISLNDNLLQGPDLTNSLMGVLCRFREEPVAFVCDIEQMFLQFKVKPEHRDYLRFLWWDDYNDLSKEPVEFRMKAHLFGATSSPGCANFALKRIATDNEHEFGSNVADFIRNDFYVDDGLKSVATVEAAVDIVLKSQEMCKKGGLRLHKFRSNSMEVLAKIDPNDRASDMKNIDLINDTLPLTKTLGVQWNIELDSFQFRIDLADKPFTRRGVLSTLSSIYDPLGFIAPVILNGKRILQESCFEKTDWDDPLNENLRQRWEQWRHDILNLKDINIQRCLKPDDFGSIVTCEIHHFSDASTSGYGQCSYLRLIDNNDRVHCSLLIAKARVTPRKSMTIPRLELSAALVSVRMSRFLRKELNLEHVEPTEWFWTDSNIVLGYISNESRRFHVFVANRVQQIRQYSEPERWKHVETNSNPADVASRGASVTELRDSKWFTGPDYLWTTKRIESDTTKPECEQTDPEVKRINTLSTHTEKCYNSILDRLEYFSDWQRAKRAIAICLNLKDALRSKSTKNSYTLEVKDLHRAELEILRHLQNTAFKDEIDQLHALGSTEKRDDRQFARLRNTTLKQTSSLYKLDPFLDSDGILRVGGRIKRSNFDSNFKHPVILPRHSHVTNLVIRYCHEQVKHQGRGLTINELRSRGYWIIGCSSAVTKLLSDCVTCRKLRSQTQTQKMADLPCDRLEAVPPFTYCGVDLFGPFLVKEGRKELKRYGVVFTCLASRAVHIETANSLDTSSFINALRRLICLRGPIRHLRSDQGSNFIGAKRELKEAFSEMDANRIRQYLLDNGCDYIEFKMNFPSSSHMGGIWERQIRSIRNILATLLDQLGTQLDDESLRTFMCEASAIINSRPLTVGSLNDPLSDEPLTPNHLLTMKSNIILPPPGEFVRGDLYSRKRWRRTQYLANQFWDRWRKEFVSNLQSRQKWIPKRRNMCVGDVVTIKDENLARNMWRLGRIVETIVDEDGLVRKARIAIGTSDLSDKGVRRGSITILERPIHKIVLLRETEETPTKEP